ncbi:MAG: hypothetical protein F4186_06195 [Boseongicola sp. SB0676_bin_33]|uniref:Uncharacterized protein n=1 Tax=Boseongicola sp. SB0664_bin_43 TaxID=2604844 RepID=A0A6B0XZE1_9RHOB|nr:hypothetical protein [Boseongicola sp. SB0664_bin_43]MYF88969.1 hypothetical protein [Boseongicola sp. SB0676_bin_33]MYK33228.1 hypothetical protein [Boseongicola sp. SB0670_bin_30]
MAHLTQIHDRGVAGFVRGPEIAQSHVEAGVVRMPKALVPEIGQSEFNPEMLGSHVRQFHTELFRGMRIVTASALVRVAT